MVDMCSFVSMIWAIWRLRNEPLYGAKPQQLGTCQAYHKKTFESCRVILQSKQFRGSAQPNVDQSGQQENQARGISCFVDGSWDPSGTAGIGICLMEEDRVIGWVSKAIQALGPTQAEARAVLEGIRAINTLENTSGAIYTDSLETVHALSHKQPAITDWRSYGEIWQAWLLMNDHQDSFTIQYCNRESAGIARAYDLENQARMYQWDRKGDLEPVFSLEEIE